MKNNYLKITEFQAQICKNKQNLNFNENLLFNNDKKKTFNKLFRNYLDIFIKSLNAEGVLFFGFTLNYPNFIKDSTNAWILIHDRVEELLHLLKINIELLEFVYVSIECHGERQAERENILNLEEGSTQNNNKNINKKKKKNIYEQTLDISLEEQRTLKGLPHLHGIIGIRSLIGKNPELCNQLQKMLVFHIGYEDVLIKQLNTIKQIKGYWNYVIKEQNYNFHRFSYFSSFFNHYYLIFEDFVNRYNFDDKYIGWGGDYIKDAKSNNIKGIGTFKIKDHNILIYLFNLFLTIKQIKINNNNLYHKIDRSKFSWERISELNYLRLNSFNILDELIKISPVQLESNKQMIKNKFVDIIDDVIIKIQKNNYFLPNIEFTKNILEFKEGLYFMNYDYFFNYDDQRLNINKLNFNCSKYFNKTYKYCSENKPEEWLKLIGRNFLVNENSNEIDQDKLNEFCANLGSYFNSIKVLNKKKKTICIEGVSDSGKSGLIISLLTEVLGEENIATGFNYGGQFAFEHLEKKVILICDEFKYFKNNRSDLLKIMNNETIAIDKKGIQKKDFIFKGTVLFAFNQKTNQEFLDDPAFINRILLYSFTKKLENINLNIKKILDDELPQIVLHCNKLFFNQNQINNYNTKTYKRLISNKIIYNK